MIEQPSENDLILVENDSPSHSIDHGLGLLEDFLLHVRVELALHDLVQLQLNAID